MTKSRAHGPSPPATSRRAFLEDALILVGGLCLGAGAVLGSSSPGASENAYDWRRHYYGMLVRPGLCIGCGRCATACKIENDVPREPFYYRTWIERYVRFRTGETLVDSPDGGMNGFPPPAEPGEISASFFVPKTCNHCEEPPCVQVCPVGATYKTVDGVVLVDGSYCIGCRYCIQACPYGARYIDPTTMTADKCTFCYHRVVKGLTTACTEVCPTGARLFGDLKNPDDPLARFLAKRSVQVLKPQLNTRPKLYYTDLDREVN